MRTRPMSPPPSRNGLVRYLLAQGSSRSPSVYSHRVELFPSGCSNKSQAFSHKDQVLFAQGSSPAVRKTQCEKRSCRNCSCRNCSLTNAVLAARARPVRLRLNRLRLNRLRRNLAILVRDRTHPIAHLRPTRADTSCSLRVAHLHYS
jgi:hypothetical protein